MVDVNDDANGGGYRRVEVLTGSGRRRKWSDADKARIVAETLEPGAVVAEVARRRQLCPQQIFGWRREMRTEAPTRLEFVPIVPALQVLPAPELEPTPEPAAAPACTSSIIEVQVADATLRITSGSDEATLTMVLRALRFSAT